MLPRVRPTKAPSKILKLLDDVTKICTVYKELSARPYCYHVSLPPVQTIFNLGVDHRAALVLKETCNTCVYTDIHFGNATWLESKLYFDTWFALFNCWSTVYIAILNHIRSDRHAGIKSELIHNFTQMNWVKLQLSPVRHAKCN